MLNMTVLPKKIRKVETFWRKFPDLYLAGGAVRSLFDGSEVSDYDFFVPSKERMLEIKAALDDYPEGDVVFKCPEDRVYTITHRGSKVQMVWIRDFTTVEDLLSLFDFTVAAAAIERGPSILEVDENVEVPEDAPTLGIAYYLHTHEDFLTHIIDRELHPAGTSFNPTGAMLRLQKYGKKGYRATTGMLLAISRMVVRINEGEPIPELWSKYNDLGAWNPRVD